LHDLGYVHHDLAPWHFMIDHDPLSVKLIGFTRSVLTTQTSTDMNEKSSIYAPRGK
jgi:hypothetical protein